MNRRSAMSEAGQLLNDVESRPRRFHPYPAYKPSGVEWLGQIPEQWQTWRLKYLGRIKYGLGEPPARKNDGIPFIRATDIHQGKIDGDAVQRVDPENVPWSRDPELRAKDILVVRSGAYTGDSAIVPNEWAGSVAGYDMVLTVTKAVPEFVAYALLSKYLLEGQIYFAKARAAQPHLNAEELGGLLAIVPPPDQQRAIAAFLDRETAKIDGLVAKKQRLIELLKEKRTALISHAVTKGLNSDAPMKPSGIDWLGDVPTHWEVKRLKTLFSNLNNRRVPLSAEERGGMAKIYAYYGASGIIDHVNDYLFDEPLILVAEDGANLLSRSTPLAFIASGQYWVNNHAHILRANSGALTFWEAALQLAPLEPLVSGSAQPKLTKENLGTLRLPVPLAEEQDAIAQMIDGLNQRYSEITASIQNAIDRLTEYRSALISAAVTGKIDVRGEV